MANTDQKIILIENAYEEIKKICINLQRDTNASNLEIKKEWISNKRFIPDLELVLSRFKFYNLTPLVDCQS